ncbi:hypothetical protein bcgnr5390_51550 [Bacillus luti]
MKTAFEKGAEAAVKGAEYTKEIVARMGRAGTVGERSLGYPDAATPVKTKIPTPIIPPNPIAINCYKPNTRFSPVFLRSFLCKSSMDFFLVKLFMLLLLLFVLYRINYLC